MSNYSSNPNATPFQRNSKQIEYITVNQTWSLVFQTELTYNCRNPSPKQRMQNKNFGIMPPITHACYKIS